MASALPEKFMLSVMAIRVFLEWDNPVPALSSITPDTGLNDTPRVQPDNVVPVAPVQ